MKPLDLPGIVAFLKANSEAPNDPKIRPSEMTGVD